MVTEGTRESIQLTWISGSGEELFWANSLLRVTLNISQSPDSEFLPLNSAKSWFGLRISSLFALKFPAT